MPTFVTRKNGNSCQRIIQAVSTEGRSERMRVSQELILREIAGEHILVPVGEAALRFQGMITLN